GGNCSVGSIRRDLRLGSTRTFRGELPPASWFEHQASRGCGGREPSSLIPRSQVLERYRDFEGRVQSGPGLQARVARAHRQVYVRTARGSLRVVRAPCPWCVHTALRGGTSPPGPPPGCPQGACGRAEQ